MNRDGGLGGRYAPEADNHNPLSNFSARGNSPSFLGNFEVNNRSDSSGGRDSMSPSVLDTETFRRSLSLSNRPGSANYDRL